MTIQVSKVNIGYTIKLLKGIVIASPTKEDVAIPFPLFYSPPHLFIKFVKEIVAFIVCNDKCRHILNTNFSDCLHSKIFKIDHFN